MRSLICFGRFVVAAVFCGSVISSEFLPAGETKELNRPAHQMVCSGADAGGYAAFPDICRTTEGDLICVFYSGYGHVSVPTEKWPNGGRIMAVRSTNGGLNWGKPFVISDTLHDDRDPHIALLSDGTLICNWFIAVNPARPRSDDRRHAMYLSRSSDNGQSWGKPEEIQFESPDWYVCSAPVRELSDGSLILGLYTETAETNRVFGATIRSHDRGRSWTDLATIGENSGLYLDAETDVIPLTDGTLLAALRSSKTDLYFSTSRDSGKSWSEVRSSGFRGHCPHFLRHSSGTLLLTHRLPATALHWSVDDGKTWHGPLKLDDVGGAYPGCVEQPDGRVFCVYYEEGEGSGIRGIRLNVTREGVEIEAGNPAP